MEQDELPWMACWVAAVRPTRTCGVLGQEPESFVASGHLWLSWDLQERTCLLGEEHTHRRLHPYHLLVTSLDKSWLLCELLGFEPDL